MSLAENLLNSLDATAYQNMRIAGSVEEEHIKVGQDRVITVPNALKTIAVKGDKDVETTTIDCVRYWDENDLSTFAIYLNYILPNGDEGTYIPKTITKSEDFFSFDWEIGSEFTYAQGKLTFWIVTKLTDDNGELVKQWSSFQNSDCSIAQGGDKIYVPEKQTDQDVISQAISISRASAETAEQQANLAIEAANKAALDASQAAEEEVSRIIGELGVVQELGDSPNSVVSQAKVTKEFSIYNSKITRNSKRITNLEQGLPSEQFMTDSTVAHVKDVPVNALPFAEVSKVGGMTRKCTNLIPYPYAETTKTLNGITFTDNGDGSITVNGTSTGVAAFEFSTDRTLFKAWRTYTINGTVGDVAVDVLFSGVTWGGKGTFTVTEAMMNASNIVIQIRIISGKTLNNVTVIPMLNEGSIALPYEPYYEGLRDAKVTEIESVGKNLWNATWEQGDIDASSGNEKTVSTSIRSDFVRVFPNTTYTIKRSITVEYNKIRFYDKDKNFIGSGDSSMYELTRGHTYGNPMLGGQSSFVATITNPRIAYIRIVDTSNDLSTVYSMYLGNYNEADIPEYSPYTRNTLPIPEAIQALDGYGWGVNADCYNYIDWDKKQFVKRVGVVDLGTLNWSAWSDVVFGTSSLKGLIKPVSANEVAAALCSDFEIHSYMVAITSALKVGVAVSEAGSVAVYTGNSMDINTFKAAMQGVMLYYELATPEVTDISDLLSADNFLAVEGGGTVTAVNENGLEAPSEITYMLKETTV